MDVRKENNAGKLVYESVIHEFGNRFARGGEENDEFSFGLAEFGSQ